MGSPAHLGFSTTLFDRESVGYGVVTGQVHPLFDYLLLAAMIGLAAVFGAASMVVSRLLAPSKPTRAKLVPYECGIVPTRDLPERFPVQFYLVAVVYLLFDVEIVFLYPWAVRYRDLGVFGFFEMLVFTALLLAAFVFLVKEGAFDWVATRRLEAGATGGVDDELAASRRAA